MPQAAQALPLDTDDLSPATRTQHRLDDAGQSPDSIPPLQPAPEGPQSGSLPENASGTDLKSAFELFNQMSQQLADSYSVLENRVSELNRELKTVTAQRLSELAEKERLAHRLESLLNFLPGGVVVLDATGRVSECNPAAREMLGEPLDGQSWRDVIVRCFAPRRDDGHEVSTRDGRRISIATRSLGEDGQIILLTDQTETRRLQAELSRHERLSALGKMVSALAHQIRTPLSAAMLYAGHLCGSKIKEPQRQRFSEKLLKRLNHMERQVQDMLLFVKGEIPLNDWVTAAELQRALADEMEVVITASGAQCSWDNQCPEQFLLCHREALVGALLNLVNNALQAVESQARLHIRLALTPEQQLAVSVVDQGPGIPADIMDTVSDLFVTTKPQGTGLGLAVVESVARAHKGRFVLQSEPGQGTCATLILPVADFYRTSESLEDDSSVVEK